MRIMNEDGTVSGSFINMLITFVYLAGLIAAVFVPFIADALIRLKELLTWFFTASFGIWSVTRTISSFSGGGNQS